jgi:hypothetical protein
MRPTQLASVRAPFIFARLVVAMQPANTSTAATTRQRVTQSANEPARGVPDCARTARFTTPMSQTARLDRLEGVITSHPFTRIKDRERS